MTKINHKNINIKESLLKGSFSSTSKEDIKTLEAVPMIVTLDQLKPSFVLPRQKRNPKYNEIKQSIAMRGLDSPPAITKRPGEDNYVISDGGNTRLDILNELWKETKDEFFFRIHCLFKPWVSEIHSLVGHLAENELHSDFTFIEKAIGIAKARSILEKEKGQLSQRALADELKKNGFPISQSHIVKMEQAIRYLYPYIPDVLYDGLGIHQVEKLISFRSILAEAYNTYKESEDITPFEQIFEQVLIPFNIDTSVFSVETVKDELIGAFAKELDIDYNTLLADVVSKKIGNKPSKKSAQISELDINKKIEKQSLKDNEAIIGEKVEENKTVLVKAENQHPFSEQQENHIQYDDIEHESIINGENQNSLKSENVLPNELQHATQSIEQEISELFSARERSLTRSEEIDEFEPIPDLWRLDALHINSVEHLKAMIGRIASDLAISYELEEYLKPSLAGIGFTYTYEISITQQPDLSKAANLVNAFLKSISTGDGYPMKFDNEQILGSFVTDPVIDDKTLIRMFRMIRALRQLNELKRVRG